MKKYMILISFFVVLVVGGYYLSQKNNTSEAMSNYASTPTTTIASEASKPSNLDSDLFSNLQITNVSFSKDAVGWYVINGEMKNTGNVAVMGYITIGLYDENGKLIDSSLISVPGSNGLKPNQSGIFKETISQKVFKKYKFSDSELIKVN